MREGMRRNIEIERTLDKVDQDIDALGKMINELNVVEVNWEQIGEYLSWVRAKMTSTYRLTAEERIFHQIVKVDALLARIDQKHAYANGL